MDIEPTNILRSDSPLSHCVSVKTNRSRNLPPTFAPEPKDEPGDRSDSPLSKCLSLKTNFSKENPPNFELEPKDEPRRSESPLSQCESVETDDSRRLSPTSNPEPEDGPPAALGDCSVCQSGPALQKFNCGHGSCGDCSSTDLCCPQCGKKPRQLHPSQQVSLEQKQRLRIRCGSVSEGDEYGECSSSLQKVYSELYITEGFSEGAREQHEVSQIEADSKKKSIQETVIRCSDIFKPLPTERLQGAPLRVVLTLGVAGAGKTFAVRKFCLDWAWGSENQELQQVVPLSFREMNLLTTRGRYSLMELIQAFHPELPPHALSHSEVLIICDGLDESRLPLDFNCEVVSEVTQRSEVSVLLVNLIRGNLLPHAQIWITSRPAAAGQIPARCVDRVTEVRGFFTDRQKEQFFKKKFTDEETVNTVLSHLRTSRSLFNMCQIPLFSWITATVLEHVLKTSQGKALPQTLTELYAHFMMIQTKRKTKYHRRFKRKRRRQMFTKNDRELLLKLGRLAFEHLQKGNIMFYQEDLEQVGLDLSEASVDSGLCTEIFKRQSVVFDKKVYCFVHLSIQEFMAAVYIHHCFSTKNTQVLRDFLGGEMSQYDPIVDSSYEIFLKRVMEVSLGSKTGHLDLFVRFLHGLSLETNHRVLGTLLGPHKTNEETILKVINNLKEMNLKNISPDRSINIFHCLMEMNDHSVQQQIQDFLRAETSERKVLSEIQCSALAYMLQMSEQVLEELDLTKYNTTREGKWRLIPAVRNCRKALLCGCGLTETHSEVVSSALKSNPSHLQELDVGTNHLQETGLSHLGSGLASPNCRLTVLRLPYCGVAEAGCSALASALRSSPFSLTVLDLSHNELQDGGLEQVCGFLRSPHCALQTLGLNSCSFSEEGCRALGSALEKNPSHLKELDVSGNELKDAGIKHLCGFLQRPECRLELLGLKCCSLTGQCCSTLTSALKSNSSLRTLDLTENTLHDSGVSELRLFLQSSQLHTLRLRCCSVTETGCAALASALVSNPSHLQELDLSYNKIWDSGVQELCSFLQDPKCGLQTLRLSYCRVSDKGCSALGAALRCSPSDLKELDLSRNRLKDLDVKPLREFQLHFLRWQ